MSTWNKRVLLKKHERKKITVDCPLKKVNMKTVVGLLIRYCSLSYYLAKGYFGFMQPFWGQGVSYIVTCFS